MKKWRRQPAKLAAVANTAGIAFFCRAAMTAMASWTPLLLIWRSTHRGDIECRDTPGGMLHGASWRGWIGADLVIVHCHCSVYTVPATLPGIAA
jgi:hypothetical protein